MTEFIPVDVGKWSLFAQIGASGDMIYLGCTDLGDVDQALGDITNKYCPDPVNGGWKRVGAFQGEESPTTFDTSTLIGTTANDIDNVNCPVTFYLVYIPCGQIQLFQNWANVGLILPHGKKTNNSWQTLRKRTSTDNGESLKVISWASDSPIEVWDLIPQRQSILETAAINAIVACNNKECQSNCSVAKDTCTDMILVTDAPAGSPSVDADVWFTSDGGANWTEGIIDPFGPAEDISSAICVDLDSSTTRHIVARGTTDAANPAEIAYSDDGGVTWTNVDVGSTNGQYVVGNNAMFTPNRDPNNIWLVTSGGYIYYSSDGAETWTAQEEGVITAGNYLVIHGSSKNILYAGAQADVIVRSTDGGLSWSAVTATGGGGEIQAAWVFSLQRAFVGTDDGTLWLTENSGTTWTQVTGWAGSGIGEITAIKFSPNNFIGYMAVNNATPSGSILQTINGGVNWRAIPNMIANNGLNNLFVCDDNKLFAVGEPGDDGTAVIIKVENVT